MSTLFLSHSTLDKRAALEVHRRLMVYGYSSSQIFLDSDADSGIGAGDKWEQEIYERLKDCKALVVLCSENWQQSKWCFAELVYAKAMGKEILPIILDDFEFGGIVAEHQAVRLQQGEEAHKRILQFLESRHLGPTNCFSWDPDECPYPGMLSFDERHAGVFFGREPEIESVLQRLRQMRSLGEPRFLMVVGSSGSGKSSLLKAGVLPRLKHQQLNSDWVVLPTLRFAGTSDNQRSIFQQLARDVVSMFPPDERKSRSWESFRDSISNADMEAAAAAFVDMADSLTFSLEQPNATVVLPIDQFEEFLSREPGTFGYRFVGFLKSLYTGSNGRLLAISTMRSDYEDALDAHEFSLAQPFYEAWRLSKMPHDRVRNIIVSPAEVVDVEIAPDLLERLIHDTDAEALPLLAFTLERLFKRYADDKLLELAEYDEIGGMSGAVQNAVNKIVTQSLTAPQIAALRLTFMQGLVSINDRGEPVRKACHWDQVPENAKELLATFVQERLLVRQRIDGVDDIEVAHEAIFDCWEQLKQWLEESADVIRWRDSIERDRNAKDAWSGLSPTQLAIARRWHRTRVAELTESEIAWIRKALLKENLRTLAVVSAIALITLLAIGSWRLKLRADEKRIEADEQRSEVVKKQESFDRVLGNMLSLYKEPTVVGGEIARVVWTTETSVKSAEPEKIAAIVREAKEEIGNKLLPLTSGPRQLRWPASISERIVALQEAVNGWDPTDAQSTERLQIGHLLKMSHTCRDIWQHEFENLTREDWLFAQNKISRETYNTTITTIDELVTAPADEVARLNFEALYWSELAFLETKEVENAMYDFRLALEKKEIEDLAKLGKAVRVECKKALTSLPNLQSSTPTLRGRATGLDKLLRSDSIIN